jgi:cation-transporting ATPase 13A1
LKPNSKSVIQELNQTGHGTVMITGDAILTAVEVARQVAIIPTLSSQMTVYRIQSCPPKSGPKTTDFEFECVDITGISNDRLPLERSELPKLVDLKRQGLARFSIEGDVLLKLARHSTKTTTPQDNNMNNDNETALLLHPSTQEFLAPHQKEAVVAAYNHGRYRTLMVGDGTNYVGALKRAHIGISIISAPEVEAKQRNASDALTKIKKKKKKNKGV